DYAPPTRSYRKMLLRRGLILVALVAIALAGWNWGPRAYDLVQLPYWRYQCRMYSPSADLVVYEEDPSAVPVLSQCGAEYFAPRHPFTADTVVVHEPRCWSEYSKMVAPRQRLFY